MIGQEGVTWNKFCQAFISRFGELDTELVFDRFKRLQQSTTVEAYYDEFEKCRGQLLDKIPSLTNEYFMENFIGGLQTEIRGMIRLLEPSSLEQALKLARHYEQSITPQQKKTSGETGNYKSGPTKQTSAKIYPSTFSSTTPATGKQSILTTEKEIEGISAKPRPLTYAQRTYAQREERRQKGLCFYCDDKFTMGHQCKKPQNFLMISEGEEKDAYTDSRGRRC